MGSGGLDARYLLGPFQPAQDVAGFGKSQLGTSQRAFSKCRLRPLALVP